MWEYAIKGFTVLMLGITAIQDIRWKKVRVAIVWAAALLICLCIPFSSRMPVIERLLGVISGLGVVLLSKITGGKIGLGDGLVLAVTGMGLGFWGNIELFALALALAAVFSIGLIIIRRANRKKIIPFIPFILLAYMLLNISYVL